MRRTPSRITVTKTIEGGGRSADSPTVLTASVRADDAYLIGGSVLILLGLAGVAFALWRGRNAVASDHN